MAPRDFNNLPVWIPKMPDKAEGGGVTRTVVPFTNLNRVCDDISVRNIMKITEAGKQLVESRKFALELREFLSEFHSEGMSEEQGRATAISLIAWAASGHDVNHPPASEELLELAVFVDSNASQVNALADKCLDNLVDNDTDGTVH